MPKICIQGNELEYTDRDIICFDEGLIGLPQLRRMVLIQQEEIAPFLWLAPLDEESIAFLVVDPRRILSEYSPSITAEITQRIGATAEGPPLVLAIVVIEAEWQNSTMNLRAPIFVSPDSMRGAQIPLVDSVYKVNEPFPRSMAA